MEKMTKREKIIACLMSIVAICSVAVMASQLSSMKRLEDFKQAAAVTAPVTINWYEPSTGISSDGESQTKEYLPVGETYIINTKSKKIHSPDCQYAQNIADENKQEISSDELSKYADNGYSVCSKCGAR